MCYALGEVHEILIVTHMSSNILLCKINENQANEFRRFIFFSSFIILAGAASKPELPALDHALFPLATEFVGVVVAGSLGSGHKN